MVPISDAQWYIQESELGDTPSAQAGCSLEDEITLRTKGVNFIHGVGSALRLPQFTLATASVFYHRFFLRHSFKEYHHYEMAGTALFLSTKIEETGRRLKDVVAVCIQKARKDDLYVVDINSKEYSTWQDVILFNEEALVAALCFDLSISHPYPIALVLGDQLGWTKEQKLMASQILNDSLRSCACIIWRPEIVAAACMVIASRFDHHLDRLPFTGNWPEMKNKSQRRGSISRSSKPNSSAEIEAATIHLLRHYIASPWGNFVKEFLNELEGLPTPALPPPVAMEATSQPFSHDAGHEVIAKGREIVENEMREKVDDEQEKSEERLDHTSTVQDRSPNGKRKSSYQQTDGEEKKKVRLEEQPESLT